MDKIKSAQVQAYNDSQLRFPCYLQCVDRQLKLVAESIVKIFRSREVSYEGFLSEGNETNCGSIRSGSTTLDYQRTNDSIRTIRKFFYRHGLPTEAHHLQWTR